MTREEALSNVRSFIGQLTEDCQESIRELVPELRESEDERIRREILSFLKEGHPYYCPDSKRRQEWLAYLEKQKDEAQKQFNLGVQAGREEVMYEMEKEQKPAEWSEEDERMLKRIIERGQSQIQMFETGLTPKQVYWLKSLPEKYGLCYKPEWGEEDALCLEKALNAVSQVYGLNGPTSRWLKSLRPQPYWKPED